jgi:AraC-like DNA-binding protein
MPPWETIPTIRHGPSGGSATRILCGYLQCRDLLFDPFLKVLPPLLHVRPEGAQAEWFAATTRYALDEAGRTPKGGLPLFTRLPELLFIDCLRRFAATGTSAQPGVFLGLRDPIVGRALVKLHRDPGRPWTVPLLARECAVSRSVLADRFTRALGFSPMQYLTRWRLQLAAHRLATTQATLAQITAMIGYESEAAFSRAFKRHLGTSPAQWRDNRRARPS